MFFIEPVSLHQRLFNVSSYVTLLVVELACGSFFTSHLKGSAQIKNLSKLPILKILF